MAAEKQLIEKNFYQTLLKENETKHPIQLLGELFQEEQKKVAYDLSYVRYAQGEVYFHHKDYEAAIFKWENIENELAPWARKNIGDAYFELGLFSSAEEMYRSIETDSKVLKAEASLKLFSLHRLQGEKEKAYEAIRDAVSINPDHGQASTIAIQFYEEQEDWDKAVHLTVEELIRTEKAEWFQRLINYVEQGFVKEKEPDYFFKALTVLYRTDVEQFEKLAVSLWRCYKHDQKYFIPWLKTINNLIFNVKVDEFQHWDEISRFYEESYNKLLGGSYLLKELQDIMPDILANWLKLSTGKQLSTAAAAVVAWSEIYRSSLDEKVIEEAENVLASGSHDRADGHEAKKRLFAKLVDWAEINQVNLGQKYHWILKKIFEQNEHYLLIVGESGFARSLLGHSLPSIPSSKITIYCHEDRTDIKQINNESITDVFAEEDAAVREDGTIVAVCAPNDLLNDHKLSLIEVPDIEHVDQEELKEYIQLADGLVYVHPEHQPASVEKMVESLASIALKKELPIYFLLEDSGMLHNHFKEQILDFFPEAEFFPFPSRNEGEKRKQSFAEFIHSRFPFHQDNKTEKLLFFLKKAIKYAYSKRMELEQHLEESIDKNKEIVSRLKGLIHSLGDMENEKAKELRQSLRSTLEEIKKDLHDELRTLLRSASKFITENSDFSHLHIELNKKMNDQVKAHFAETLLPKMSQKMGEWVSFAESELKQCQVYLDEMCESFNSLYGHDRVKLMSDFKVVDDWRRDIDRLTTVVNIEEENIMNRFKPAQVILKGAGKLFSSIGKNKLFIAQQYKKYIETETFDDAIQSMIRKFFAQFDLFEKGIERDVKMFFREPVHNLEQIVQEGEQQIRTDQQQLDSLKTNPEIYYDPLTVFELNLRQCEILNEYHSLNNKAVETNINKFSIGD